MLGSVKNERGNLSLVGLLAGVAIIGLLMYFVLLPKLNTSTNRAVKEGLVKPKDGQSVYSAAMDKGKETECMSNLREIRQMIHMEKDANPGGQLSGTLQEMKAPNEMMSCPVSKQRYVYDPTAGTVRCVTEGHDKL